MEEQDAQQKQASEGKEVKERPVWLTQSTVQGAYSEPDILQNSKWSFLASHPPLTSEYPAFTLSWWQKVLDIRHIFDIFDKVLEWRNV